MRAITFYGTDLEINYTQSTTAGHGHAKITVELFFQGEYKNFSATTSNMSDYDGVSELEGGDKDEVLFSIVSHQLADQIYEWIMEIENK